MFRSQLQGQLLGQGQGQPLGQLQGHCRPQCQGRTAVGVKRCWFGLVVCIPIICRKYLPGTCLLKYVENRFAIYEVWKLCSVTMRDRLPTFPYVPNRRYKCLGLMASRLTACWFRLYSLTRYGLTFNGPFGLCRNGGFQHLGCRGVNF